MFRNWVFQNFPFLENDFDALTDYELFCKICEYVINYSKDNEYMMKKIEEFQKYLDNLDLQDEVNNKLDEMAEGGELEELVIAYTSLKALITFDTVDDMVASENLINGSKVKTLGFYVLNDGGGAYYNIREKDVSDTADNIHLFDLTNSETLIAELIVDDFNVLKFGAKSNEDSTDAIEYVLSIVNNGDKIIIPAGTYLISNELEIDKNVILEGTSTTASTGTTLSFDGTNGLILKNSYIDIKNINIEGNNKLNYNVIDIDNNVYGTVGIVNEFGDTYKSGGCTLEFCNIHGFNIGILMYSIITDLVNKWSGAYRSFVKTHVTYNDIGYLCKDGSTYNKIIDGNISNNAVYGIYCDTDTFYQNLEVIGTAIENNGFSGSFTTEINSFGIYAGNKSKIKLTNSYVEKSSIYVNKNGTVILDNTYIHNNVTCFGLGNIISKSSHAPSESILNYGDDLATNSTNTGLTLTNTLGDSIDQIRIQSSNSGTNVLNLPNLDSIPIPLKDVNFIKFECDVKVTSGYTISTFGLYPATRVTGLGDSGYDNISVGNNYSLANMKIENNKWTHLVYYMKPRIGVEGYITDTENEIYRIATSIYFTNNASNLDSDFTGTSLDMQLANPRMTIYADTKIK